MIKLTHLPASTSYWYVQTTASTVAVKPVSSAISMLKQTENDSPRRAVHPAVPTLSDGCRTTAHGAPSKHTPLIVTGGIFTAGRVITDF